MHAYALTLPYLAYYDFVGDKQKPRKKRKGDIDKETGQAAVTPAAGTHVPILCSAYGGQCTGAVMQCLHVKLQQSRALVVMSSTANCLCEKHHERNGLKCLLQTKTMSSRNLTRKRKGR